VLIPGQPLVTFENLTNGSRTTVKRIPNGASSMFSTPVNWEPNYDVETNLGGKIQSGDQLIASQKLCTDGPKLETPPVKECSSLGAPRIRTPLAGNEYVVVDVFVPGARIRVYDSSNKEIGDGVLVQ
jgi:hypothetical protein